MAARSRIPSPSAISAKEFHDALRRYPGLLQSVSLAKGAKNGQRTLVELDEYRYREAVDSFGRRQSPRAMALDDVKTLVEWKLNNKKYNNIIKPTSTNNHNYHAPPHTSKPTPRFPSVQVTANGENHLVDVRVPVSNLSLNLIIPSSRLIIPSHHPVRRHGKFRPSLMKLVSSNDPALVEEAIGQATSTILRAASASGASSNTEPELDSSPDFNAALAALAVLTRLKGVGPATASLILAVHDPHHIIFFSDEAFHWLCGGGGDGSGGGQRDRMVIKYNTKEYGALLSEARRLAERLGVTALDVEKVAFVLMNSAGESALVGSQDAIGAPTTKPRGSSRLTPTASSGGGIAGKKRDNTSPDSDAIQGPRRSKRHKGLD